MRQTQRFSIAAFLVTLLATGSAHAQTAAAPPAATQPTAAQPTAGLTNALGSGAEEVEPEARQALQKMSNYLGTLKTFEIKGQTSLDLVTENGQRVMIDGTSNYKVRRPDGFVISVDTDWKKRTFYYDGKQFVAFAPELGFYASSPAPPTILQTLDAIDEKYGISLPIEDLFRWGDGKGGRGDELRSAFNAGVQTVDGVKTDHYVFRQGNVDWQVWIESGDRPLPRKLVIVDRSDAARPTYTAKLSWTLNPTFRPDEFAFRPGATAKAIKFAVLETEQKP